MIIVSPAHCIATFFAQRAGVMKPCAYGGEASVGRIGLTPIVISPAYCFATFTQRAGVPIMAYPPRAYGIAYELNRRCGRRWLLRGFRARRGYCHCLHGNLHLFDNFYLFDDLHFLDDFYGNLNHLFNHNLFDDLYGHLHHSLYHHFLDDLHRHLFDDLYRHLDFHYLLDLNDLRLRAR